MNSVRSRMRALAPVGLALALGCGALPDARAAEGFPPAKQGWVSWDTQAVQQAPAWCCFSEYSQGAAQPARCDLDGKFSGFGSRDGARSDTVRIYARMKDGQIDRLRAYAPGCEVQAAGGVQHLGEQPSKDSAGLLARLLKKSATGDVAGQDRGASRSDDLYRNALAALALHRDSSALDVLASEAHGQPNFKLRKEAVFWIGQTRGEPGLAVLKPILQGDADAQMREHAGFAVAQSRLPQAVPLLVQQGETDRSPKVRSQAWFWLAQTKSDEAERAILKAVQKETDRSVRHQAIFALSQLPGERAVKALADVAENRALDRDDRKQAVFWLGQSKSPEALAYLEKTLNRAAQ